MASVPLAKLMLRLLQYGMRLRAAFVFVRLRRHQLRLLLFASGHSRAYVGRLLIIARALHQRGYRVGVAGAGPHRERVLAEGLPFHEIETMPQSRMEDYVARGDYAYDDLALIDRSVQAERDLIRQVKPDLVIGDLRPTLGLAAALEGVDLALVEPRYKLPGYPFVVPLPRSFAQSVDPLGEYLKQQDTSLRRHKTFFLVADVPEFHPPGQHLPGYCHYVGPLIETDAPEPSALGALVGEGWDVSLPLVCLSYGSTGEDSQFLRSLMDKLAQEPYRVLMTVAGDKSGVLPSANVRFADRLPAAGAMRLAALFVDIGDMSSIYHALRLGVPIIGAPEKLDQEYHLNRVRDLGLGFKLSWQEAHQIEPLLTAIASLFSRYDEFAQRCKTFAECIEKWQGGTAAAEVIDRYFIARQCSYPGDSRFLLSEPDFVHQLELSTPADLKAKALRALLHQSLRRGLPHVRKGALVYYDQRDSWNWLYDHEPRFFESDYRALEKKRQVFFAQKGSRLVPRREQQRYRLTYRYRIYCGSPSPVRPLRLFLPYPIPTPHQGDITLCACQPEKLREYLVPTAGFFYSYPYRINPDEGSAVEFSYSCEVAVRSRALTPAPCPQTLPPMDYQRYTEISRELAASPRVRALSRKLALGQNISPQEKAHRLYLYLTCSKRFKKTKEHCQCLECSTEQVLSDIGGHCITLSRAFIALCRLEGVPAREVTGALAGYPAGTGRFEMSVYNENLWGHTWAEVFLEEFGWIPVEFHGITIGLSAMTAVNVADSTLRGHIASHGSLYLDYYFGNLDCHRVICSNSVKQIPQALTQEEGDGEPPGSPKGLRYECSLVFECT